MTIVVIAAYVLVAIAAAVAPEAMLAAAAKEGAVEQVSHAILAAAIVAWIVRCRLRPPWPAVVATLLLCLTLAEELDWGSTAIAAALDRAIGSPNLHNAGHGATYLLFALPWALWAMLPWLPERMRVRFGAHVPSRDTSRAVAVVAFASLAALLTPEAWERAIDEVDEAILYIVLFAAGVGAPAGAPIHSHRG